MKRFYDAVDIRKAGEKQWQVTLDGRGLKTVQTTPQIVPHKALALALASEWRDQSEDIDPASFPLRDMVDYAIDVVTADPAAVAGKLVDYADTDTLLYRADPDEALYARQQTEWEPIVAGFEAREGVSLKRVSGIVHVRQDEAALAHLRGRLSALDPFVLVGVEAMTNLAASLITGLSAIEADAEPLTLWRAASLEEEWQADQWGRDTEAEARRARREHDFLKACEFTQLASGLT
ncbi:MAG: ATP12 family protein [Erythrobacter sp.]